MANQGLMLRFGTDLEPARRSVQQFATNAGRNLVLLSTAAIAAGRNLDALNSGAARAGQTILSAARFYSVYKAAILGAAASMAVFTAAAAKAREAIDEMRKIAAGANAAGVGTTFFQVWESQLQSLSIKAEEARAALVRAKDATAIKVDDKGVRVESSAATVLRNLSAANGGLAGQQLDIIQNSGDAEARLRALLDALREIHKVADQFGNEDLRRWAERLAEVSFGAKGKELSDAIRSGRLEIDATAAAMTAAGSIYDQQLIARTEELDRQLAAANARLENEMKPLFQALASIALDIKGGWVAVVEAIGAAVAKAKELAGYAKAIARVLPYVGPAINAIDLAPDARGPADRTAAGVSAMDLLRGNPDARRQLESSLRSQQASHYSGPASKPAKSRAAKSSGTAEIDDVERFLKFLEKSVAILEAEAAAYGKSAVEKEKAVQLARAEAAAKERGIPLTEKEIAQVDALATRRAQAIEQQKALARANQLAKDSAQFFGDTMLNALDRMTQKGAKAKDILEDMVRSLAKAALQATILGQGPLAGLFGFAAKSSGGIGGILGLAASAFGINVGSKAVGGFVGSSGPRVTVPALAFAGAPQFASGGTVPGTRGGVPIIAHPGELILNRAQQANVARAMGGNIQIANYGGADLVDARMMPDGTALIEVAKQYTDRAVGSLKRNLPEVMNQRNLRSWGRV